MTAAATTRPPRTGGPPGDQRLRLIERALKRFDYQPDALIEVLHTAQEGYGFLSDDLLAHVAEQLHLPLSHVYGVATFYHMFSFKPLGEHTCTVCMGTACYVKRSAEILAALEATSGLKAGHTSPDNRFSLTTARCLGHCGQAPVLVLDGEVSGRQSIESAVAAVRSQLAPASDIGDNAEGATA
jgi:bidirectional [NiFe] hydrogenase diaphorase subunit